MGCDLLRMEGATVMLSKDLFERGEFPLGSGQTCP
jgi:hypothetical protein